MMKKLFSKKSALNEKNNSDTPKINALPENAFEMALEQHQRGNLAQADALYRQILQQNPRHADALHFLGVLAYQVGQSEAAVTLINQALAIDSSSCAVYNNLGLAYQKLKQFEAAIESYQKALALSPDFSDGYYNLGGAFHALGRFEQAVTYYQQAISYNPDFASARHNLGIVLLALGKLDLGFQYYETRCINQMNNISSFQPDFSFPQWQGESIQGKSLLILPEQGAGDEIQFARYVSVLKKNGAAFITLVCRKPLQSLFETLADVDQLITFEQIDAIQPHDYWAFSMSLPLYCKTTLENIPATIPYLYADFAQVQKIALELKPIREFKVGLCWKGSAAHANDANRSPGIAAFKNLFEIEGIKYFTLQPDTRNEFMAAAVNSAVDRGHEIDINSFAEAAALIANLDLIISCDTSICHLAGALGKPVWVVLPFIADWRWLIEREDSPWYPTVRLFRQSERDNWQEVFERVEQCLKELKS